MHPVGVLEAPPACPAVPAGVPAEPHQAMLTRKLQQLPCHLLQCLLPTHRDDAVESSGESWDAVHVGCAGAVFWRTHALYAIPTKQARCACCSMLCPFNQHAVHDVLDGTLSALQLE